ncbi:cytochrome P450/oxidoreductase [Blastococcus sp. SYSU D00813]
MTLTDPRTESAAAPAGEQFDHHSPEANADPVAYYRRFRETQPVGWTEAHEGFFFTTRHADVVRIARDDATFSSERAPAGDRGISFVIPFGPGLEQYPIELDPPRATPYRELINPLLTFDAVERLKPMIARHTTAAIDAFVESGSVDFVRDLTNPVPAAVTLDWLGFPTDDWKKLAGPVHDIFASVPGTERAMRGVEGLMYLESRIRELIAARRADPRDDAVSVLVHAEHPEGRPFTEQELVSVMYLLVAGGVDTTTSLTGSTLVWLSEHPEERQRLIDDPDLLDVAVEEFLRVFAPSQSMARTLLADAEVGGVQMHAGQRVLIPWVAANHDPEVFPDPETVVLDRNPQRHLAFGIGTHRCAGAHLARAMFGEMMRQVLTRLPDYRVLPEGLVPYPTRGNQTGWDAIPALFTPGPRLGSAPAPAAIVTRELEVTGVRAVATDVVAVTFADPTGAALPPWTPGAHLEVRLPSGRLRQYSLCGDPAEPTWTVAVLREAAGRGGSVELHELARSGARLTVRGPRNHFPLVEAPDYLLVAGGIGVTPILAMARELVARGASVRLLYGGRTAASMAFADDLVALAGDRVQLLPQDVHGVPDLAAAVAAAGPGTAVYCCGPAPMIAAMEAACAAAGIGDRLHVERFTAPEEEVAIDTSHDVAFDVHLARTGTTVTVPADQRIVEALRDVVPTLSSDCEKGYCGACETRVLAGVPEHRDSVLTEEERAAGRSMMVCVGRARTPSLTLDL